jgi:multidrug efflux pump subunit AcrA (membrane-fusion protein)
VHEGLELEAESVAFPDEVFRGSITRVSPTIDPTTHTAQIRCEVKNPGLRLKPQMLMRVRIATDGSTARVVPQEALVFETDGYYAFVQTEQDRLVRRRVGVSSWNERGYARISSGLEPGDLVVQGESIQLNALWHRAMGESS